MNLKSIVNSLFPKPDPDAAVNSMSAGNVQKIKDIVEDKTDFTVACRDTRFVNVRASVGLVMDPQTSADLKSAAEQVLIDAYKSVLDRDLKPEQIIRYAPGNAPTVSRFVTCPGKKW